jgi:hypothetical protein
VQRGEFRPSAADKPCKVNTAKVCGWIETRRRPQGNRTAARSVSEPSRSHAIVSSPVRRVAEPAVEPAVEPAAAASDPRPFKTCPDKLRWLKPLWSQIYEAYGDHIVGANSFGFMVDLPKNKLFVRCVYHFPKDDLSFLVWMQNEFRARLGDVVPEIFEEGTGCMKHPKTGRVVHFTAMERFDGTLTNIIRRPGLPFETLLFFAHEIRKLMQSMRTARVVHGDFGMQNVGYIELPQTAQGPRYAIRLIDFATSALDCVSDLDSLVIWHHAADEPGVKDTRWKEALLQAKVPKCSAYENAAGDDESEDVWEDLVGRLESHIKRANYKPPKLPSC